MDGWLDCWLVRWMDGWKDGRLKVARLDFLGLMPPKFEH